MPRITLSLPDALIAALEREARHQGTSVPEVAREVLVRHFGLDDTGPRKLPFVALGRSGFTDTSERVEEILDEEWGRSHRR